MWFDRKGILLGCVLVIVILLGMYREPLLRTAENSYLNAAVRYCIAQDNATMCVRPFVQRMLTKTDAAHAMDQLAQRLSPLNCHYFGHVVGQEAYLAANDVETAISRCNRACDSACVHGVIGGAFAKELGLADLDEYDLDLKHLDPADIRRIGTKLCTDYGTCHGVGHALFQVYQEFAPAFDVCRGIAGSRLSMCYNGATMEFADTLSARNMSALPHVTFPELSALDTLCDFPTLQETRACYRYFPRIVRETMQNAGFSEAEALEKTKGICAAKEPTNVRMACYAGFGSYWSYYLFRSMPLAVSSCEEIGGKQAAAACIIGRLAVATEDRREVLASYCAASGDQYKPVCFQGLFFFLDRVQVPAEEQLSLCKEGDAVCIAGFENRGSDPLLTVATFPR